MSCQLCSFLTCVKHSYNMEHETVKCTDPGHTFNMSIKSSVENTIAQLTLSI